MIPQNAGFTARMRLRASVTTMPSAALSKTLASRRSFSSASLRSTMVARVLASESRNSCSGPRSGRWSQSAARLTASSPSRRLPERMGTQQYGRKGECPWSQAAQAMRAPSVPSPREVVSPPESSSSSTAFWNASQASWLTVRGPLA